MPSTDACACIRWPGRKGIAPRQLAPWTLDDPLMSSRALQMACDAASNRYAYSHWLTITGVQWPAKSAPSATQVTPAGTGGLTATAGELNRLLAEAKYLGVAPCGLGWNDGAPPNSPMIAAAPEVARWRPAGAPLAHDLEPQRHGVVSSYPDASTL